jgi:hypothetical protein
MQFFKYLLLALVGSTGVAVAGETPNTPSVKTLSADVIVQPNGGATSSFLPQDKKEDRRTTISPAYTRHKKRRHSKKYKTDTKKDGGKIN